MTSNLSLSPYGQDSVKVKIDWLILPILVSDWSDCPREPGQATQTGAGHILPDRSDLITTRERVHSGMYFDLNHNSTKVCHLPISLQSKQCCFHLFCSYCKDSGRFNLDIQILAP